MAVPFFRKTVIFMLMKPGITLLAAVCLAMPAPAEARQGERKSLLDSDPDVVYLDQALKKPVELKVIKEAPVFSDKEGKHRLGTLKAEQNVRLEAITDKIYRVRGQGQRRARDAAPDWLFGDVERLPPDLVRLWEGRWQWALYEVRDVDTARSCGRRGADFVETMTVRAMVDAYAKATRA